MDIEVFFNSSEAIYRWCLDCVVWTKVWGKEGAGLEVQQESQIQGVMVMYLSWWLSRRISPMSLTSGQVNLTTPSKKGSMCQLNVLYSNLVDLYETT